MDKFLRDALRERHWTIPQFAEACDVATGLAQKWVSANPRYRAMPNPASCEKIAAALGYDPDYVLELAGHRKARELVGATASHDPRKAAIDVVWDKLEEARKAILFEIATHKNGPDGLNGNEPVIRSYRPILALA